MPYVVPVVGREDTKCPIISFGVQDTLPIEEAHGCPWGGAIPLWQLFKSCWPATAC